VLESLGALGVVSQEPVDDRPTTSYDLQTSAQSKVDLRRIPQLSRQSLRIVWQAGRSDFVVSTVL